MLSVHGKSETIIRRLLKCPLETMGHLKKRSKFMLFEWLRYEVGKCEKYDANITSSDKYEIGMLTRAMNKKT